MPDSPTQVLLIEDNPGDADLVRLRLTESKTQVDVNCVNRLADGLASIENKPPSVVLLDLNLPDSHGPETFRKVLEKAPQVPVVILSGQEDETLAMKAIHQGVQDYLVKGDVTSRNLERSMRYAVERQALLCSLEISRKQQIEFKNQFLSHVSHELRTPLTCIHQYASLLFDGISGPISPEQRDHLQIILRSVNQLHAMIRDLLEATRAESGKLRIEPRCLALVELASQAVAMIRPAALNKRINVQMEASDQMPLVYADPDRVLEVLINLLDNAVKFTPPEGTITVKLSRQETDPEFAYVSVSDTGRGISPEALPLIFERLYQERDNIDINRTGLGLGLYIAKELVNLHGGRIWVASQLASGSTFTFNLPIYSLPKLLAPVITHEQRLRESIVLVRVNLKPLTTPVRGNWKEVCRECLDHLRRCVYVDKDLVLPAMATNGPEDTFYVVASTDMERANIMITRILGQISALPNLKSTGTVSASARPVLISSDGASKTLEQQVDQVASSVAEMVIADLSSSTSFYKKESKTNAN
ncbi:MAG TPA: hybrid sensor histidine kinase/response regulator [Terriglobales bacterium]|nr:hybrid sensor histidine kinase/response regulator [Terriglobales bacterium]